MTGGLHCGRIVTSFSASPNVVVPPLTSGLHCGKLATALSIGSAWVVPPRVGGLHCSLDTQQRPTIQVTSRPCYPLVGSIAAALSWTPTPSPWWVVLPLLGGLQCGGEVSQAVPDMAPRRSADDRRLPLRRARQAGFGVQHHPSYGHWPAGPIAA